MRTILFFTLIIGIIACGTDKDQEAESQTTVEESKEEVDDRMAPKTRPVSDREPEIEMINIDWVYKRDTAFALYKAWIQSKDAKYYMIHGKKGDEVYFELTGGHPKLQVVIIDPEDAEIFRGVLGKEPLEWREELQNYGTYRFLVQFDSSFEDKEQTKTYFEAKMRMY